MTNVATRSILLDSTILEIIATKLGYTWLIRSILSSISLFSLLSISFSFPFSFTVLSSLHPYIFSNNVPLIIFSGNCETQMWILFWCMESHGFICLSCKILTFSSSLVFWVTPTLLLIKNWTSKNLDFNYKIYLKQQKLKIPIFLLKLYSLYYNIR